MAPSQFIHDFSSRAGLREEAAQAAAGSRDSPAGTTEERIGAALRRVESLVRAVQVEQHGRKPSGSRPCSREARIADLSREIELRRQQVKRGLLKEYDEAVRYAKRRQGATNCS